MSPANILVTNRIPDGGIALLRESGAQVEVVQRRSPLTPAALRGLLAGRDGVLAMCDDPLNARVLAGARSLRVVALCAVGHDNVDTGACTRAGIRVSNTPGVLTDATAELTFALLFAAARRVVEGDRLVRSGAWSGWAPTLLLGLELRGATLGVVGAGRIGTRVAEIGAALGMRVWYHSTGRSVAIEERCGAASRSLDELVAGSDVVSLHVPLTDKTRHLIDAHRLSLMKPAAILVNTSRGGVVDETALCEALAKGRLAGAGLDVFEGEPRVSPALRECERVVLTPHMGSATHRARERMATGAARDLLRVLRGEEPENLVNTAVRGVPFHGG